MAKKDNLRGIKNFSKKKIKQLKNKLKKKNQKRLMMCRNGMPKKYKKHCKNVSQDEVFKWAEMKLRKIESFQVQGYDNDMQYASVENFIDPSVDIQKNNDLIMENAQKAEQNIQSYNEAIDNSEELLKGYSQDIKKKMNLIATRDRMLQLSQDRNVYKKKIIYMLLTILIAIFITIISFYTIYNKK
jgi:hypothetical protein